MRRDVAGSCILLAVAVLLILRPWESGDDNSAGPAMATGVVTRVVDGDTVEARVGGAVEDVRLIGVDTPESVKPGEPVECFGPRASHFTDRGLEGERVRLVFGVERRDVYGRLLAYVYATHPTFTPPQGGESRMRWRLFNAALVRRGLARSLTIPPNDRFAPLFQRLELEAARAGRGLWGACPP